MSSRRKRIKTVPHGPHRLKGARPITRKPRTGAAFWRQFPEAGLEDIVAHLHATIGRPCLLCGAPATAPASFQPDRPLAWGGRLGKLRLFVYGLCGGCATRPDTTLRVEARIQAGLGAQRN
jgi:hypothetical protein